MHPARAASRVRPVAADAVAADLRHGVGVNTKLYFVIFLHLKNQ